MLTCSHCGRLVTDMDTVALELHKPPNAMCTRCEQDHDDMMDFIDSTCEQDGQPKLSDWLRENNLPLRPNSMPVTYVELNTSTLIPV